MYTAARLASTGRAAVFSLLHLLCQKGRCHCNRLALGVLRAGGAVLGQQTHRARGAPSQGSRVFSGLPGLW